MKRGFPQHFASKLRRQFLSSKLRGDKYLSTKPRRQAPSTKPPGDKIYPRASQRIPSSKLRRVNIYEKSLAEKHKARRDEYFSTKPRREYLARRPAGENIYQRSLVEIPSSTQRTPSSKLRRGNIYQQASRESIRTQLRREYLAQSPAGANIQQQRPQSIAQHKAPQGHYFITSPKSERKVGRIKSFSDTIGSAMPQSMFKSGSFQRMPDSDSLL